MTARTVPAGEPQPVPVEEVPASLPSVPETPAEPAPAPEAPAPAEGSSAGRSRRRTFFGAEFPLSVGEAIAEVTARVPAIGKDRTASQGGTYKYRGIDDVLDALHPILSEVGLVIVPGKVVREVWETRQTSSGGTLNVARLLVRYTLVGPDGSELRAEVWGEGGDSGDKATQKAHSQSYKTLCFQTFSIPTEESARDEPDATNPPARPWTGEELSRASRAWEAARGADTLEKLAGVRHRALELLSVPVDPAGDGATLAPLTVLIDGRRGELERGTRQ